MKTQISEPGVYDNISNDDYHADPCPAPSLSSSGARKIINSCPAKYWFERNNPKPKSDALNIGQSAHDWLLTGNDWLERNAVLPEDFNGRTKEGKALKEGLLADGFTVITHEQFEAIRAMAKAIDDHEFAGACFKGGTPEQSLFWQDPEFGIWCRARLDFSPNGSPFFVDYKTTVSAEEDYIRKAMHDHGYHMQAAWYLDGISQLLNVEQPQFLFCFQEKEAPYLVTIVQPEFYAIDLGRTQNRKAREIFAECLATEHWPAYSEDVVQLGLPQWAYNKLENNKELGLYDIGAKNPNGLREMQ